MKDRAGRDRGRRRTSDARVALAWVAAVAGALAGCNLDRAADCGDLDVGPGDDLVCATSWLDRAFDLHVPAGWDGEAPLPVILLFHGGGANRTSSDRTTCPGGDRDSAACLVAQARARGFAVVVPDGTGGRPLRGVRTWNAGGGQGGWQCVSGAACNAGVDDVAYVTDVLAELGRALPLDPRRRYATGISNGGAISHRLACELSPPLAAIAPVGGANQFADTGGACSRAVPVLQIHGTADPCWEYEGGLRVCVGADGRKTSVAATMEGWRARNGCDAVTVDRPLPDLDPGDGVTVVHQVWQGCEHATEHLRLEGGGHTWPGGYQYLDVDEIGPVGNDVGSEAILDFFEAHVAP